MKTLIRRALHHIGFDIVRTHTLLEGHLARLLRALDINCVLDVGAHFGEYGRLLREIGYRGRIVSFEPIAQNFERLDRVAARDHDWRRLGVALGAERRRAQINVAVATDLSSFLPPSREAATLLGATVMRTARTETVKVELLDDVADFAFDGLAAPRAFLKLDTQGYDWHVIEGGKGMIGAHVLGMQIEIAVRALYAGVPLFPDNVRPFLALGFDVTGIFPLSHTPDLIAAIEYDLVLRRTTF